MAKNIYLYNKCLQTCNLGRALQGQFISALLGIAQWLGTRIIWNLIHSNSWWLMPTVVWDLSWSWLSEHPSVHSPCSLGFLKTWWLCSVGKHPETHTHKPYSTCCHGLRSQLISFLQHFIHWESQNTHPGSRERRKKYMPSPDGGEAKFQECVQTKNLLRPFLRKYNIVHFSILLQNRHYICSVFSQNKERILLGNV